MDHDYGNDNDNDNEIMPQAMPAAVTTLILGGVRSGKSRLAEALVGASGLPVTLIATATAGDAEMAARIAAHQARRPAHWGLIEEPLALAAAVAAAAGPGRIVLVDCLTLWLTNLLCGPDPARPDAEVAALLTLAPRLSGPVVFVSNEVNMGVIPADPLSRRFCDLAGTLHQHLAGHCGRVVLTVAGLPVVLKGAPL